MSKEKVEVKRVPLNQQNVLATNYTRPGFMPMWVNETVGAIDAHVLAGWVPVVDPRMKITTHDNLSQVESRFDSVVRRVVNKGLDAPCRTAILMEIPIEIYEEDQKAEQKLIDDKENTLKRKIEQTQFGNI